jgi:hypothetical protein
MFGKYCSLSREDDLPDTNIYSHPEEDDIKIRINFKEMYKEIKKPKDNTRL